jgi:hypothetical protein
MDAVSCRYVYQYDPENLDNYTANPYNFPVYPWLLAFEIVYFGSTCLSVYFGIQYVHRALYIQHTLHCMSRHAFKHAFGRLLARRFRFPLPLQFFRTTAFLFTAATVTALLPLPAGTTSSKRTKKYSTTKQATLRSACCSSPSQAGGTCFDTLCPRCVCSWCKYLLASKRLFQCRRTTENRLYTAFVFSIASVSCDCICSCVC